MRRALVVIEGYGCWPVKMIMDVRDDHLDDDLVHFIKRWGEKFNVKLIDGQAEFIASKVRSVGCYWWNESYCIQLTGEEEEVSNVRNQEKEKQEKEIRG